MSDPCTGWPCQRTLRHPLPLVTEVWNAMMAKYFFRGIGDLFDPLIRCGVSSILPFEAPLFGTLWLKALDARCFTSLVSQGMEPLSLTLTTLPYMFLNWSCLIVHVVTEVSPLNQLTDLRWLRCLACASLAIVLQAFILLTVMSLNIPDVFLHQLMVQVFKLRDTLFIEWLLKRLSDCVIINLPHFSMFAE